MKELNFCKNNIFLTFAIDDDNALSLLYIGLKNNTRKSISANRFFVPTEVHLTGSNADDHHGTKHTGGTGNSLKYVSHTETDTELVFSLKNDNIHITQHYCFSPDSDTIKTYAEIENISSCNIGIEYISSFCMYGFNLNKLWLCHNSWCREFEWRCYNPTDLGYNRITDFSTKRISVSNTGS